MRDRGNRRRPADRHPRGARALRYVELAFLAAVAALALTPLVRALAIRLGALDVPDPRRPHDRAVPRLGGVALVLACGVTLAIQDEPRALLAANGWDVPALIAAATLFAIGLSEGRTDAACLWATLGGALAGFLRYNFNPASIFLGDAGSLFLGYV